MSQNWCGATFRSFLWENAARTLGHQSTVRPGALFTSAFLFRKNQTASNVPKSPLKISEFRDVFWLNNVKKTVDLVKRGTSLKCFVNVFGFWVSGSSIREHWQSWKGLLTDVQHSIDPRCKLDKKYMYKTFTRNAWKIHWKYTRYKTQKAETISRHMPNQGSQKVVISVYP